MTLQAITFGKEKNYLFREIEIDEKYGTPIFLDGMCVGGLRLAINRIYKFSFCNTVEILGIEIKDGFKRKGIATEIVNMLKGQYPVIMGATVDDISPYFWRSVGAIFYKAPKCPPEQMTEYMKSTIHTDTPLIFCITEDKEVVKFFDEKAHHIMPRYYLK